MMVFFKFTQKQVQNLICPVSFIALFLLCIIIFGIIYIVKTQKFINKNEDNIELDEEQ